MTKVVIMAGGRGKRLMPLTEDTPKPMLCVNRKPILEWIIKRFTDQGLDEFYISLGYLGEKIESYFGDGKKFNARIEYLRENEPLGTVGALSLLPYQNSPFVVINGDVLLSVHYADILRFHQSHNAIITIGATTHRVEVPFGVLGVKEDMMTHIDEKPVFEYPVSAGVYVMNYEILDFLPKNKFDMPDLISTIPLGKSAVFPISGYWMDIGRHEQLGMVRALNG